MKDPCHAQVVETMGSPEAVAQSCATVAQGCATTLAQTCASVAILLQPHPLSSSLAHRQGFENPVNVRALEPRPSRRAEVPTQRARCRMSRVREPLGWELSQIR